MSEVATSTHGSPLRAMLEPDAYALLSKYGIPFPAYRHVTTEYSAVEAAEAIGYPVVVKVVSQDILHKSDVGGVRVGLTCPDDVRKTFQDMRQLCYSQNASFDGVLVVRQVPNGQEVIIGAVRDAEFGPVVMFGMGGVLVELTKDVAFALVPVTKDEDRDVVMKTMAGKIMAGVRCKTPGDIDSVVDCICQVSSLMEEHQEIQEIDLNPVMVLPSGCMTLDARVLWAR